MNRALGDRHGRFFDRLRQGRMRVAGAREIFRRTAEFHQHRRFRDHVAGVRTDNVNAEHAVGLGVGQNFHKAVGLLIGLGAAVGGEGKLAGVVSNAGGLQLFFDFPTEAISGIVYTTAGMTS